MSYPEITQAIAAAGGGIAKAQEFLRLRYSDDPIPEKFVGDGVNPFGFTQRKFSDVGEKEMNGERQPFNADRTFFIVFQAFYEKTGNYKVDIHDAKTFEKVADLDVARKGTHYVWHPFDPFKLIWGEGNKLYTVHVLTGETATLQTFSRPVEAGGKWAGGDGNHPDTDGRFVLGAKNALFVYGIKEGKVIDWKGVLHSPSGEIPTFSVADLDYAQAFAGKVVLVKKPGGVMLADYAGTELAQLHRRGTHIELGIWEGKPGVAIVRHNAADARTHGTESGRSYVVTWDERNQIERHPGDLWPTSELGGQTGGQLSWTEDGLFVALHSRQEYQNGQLARTNEVYEMQPGRARRLARHGIDKAYSSSYQPEVKGPMFKGPDGWYVLEDLTPAAPWEVVEHFIKTGEVLEPEPDPVVDPPIEDPINENPPVLDPPVLPNPNPDPNPVINKTLQKGIELLKKQIAEASVLIDNAAKGIELIEQILKQQQAGFDKRK